MIYDLQHKGRVERKSSEFQETILRHRADAAANADDNSRTMRHQTNRNHLSTRTSSTRSSEDDTSIQGTIILDGSSELEMEKEEEEEEGRKKKLKLIKDETLADTYKRCFNESLPPESGTT